VSRILIVDDDPQLGRSLERVLEREGHDCYVASDPAEAASVSREFKPDAILIELQPEYTTALPRLQEAVGAIPFVFMSSHHGEYTKLGELVRPFDDWLAKPAGPQEFVVRLRTAIRRAQAASD